MKRRRLKNMLVATTALALLTTSIPMNLLTVNLLTASAEGKGGIGGGNEGSSGSSIHVSGDTLDAFDLGLRFSLVTIGEDNQRHVVQNKAGKYYFDVWADNFKPKHTNFNSESRYDVQATNDTIFKTTASSLSNGLNGWIATQGGTSDIQFNDILNPANSDSVFITDGFKVHGSDFYNWFMGAGATINGTSTPVYGALMKYLYGTDCIQSLDLDNTFLVVEPVIDLCNTGTNQGNLSGNHYISSWYGYITHNINSTSDIDPGRSWNIRDKMSRLGNGFAFGDTEYATNDALTKVQSVLGLSMPTVKLPETGGASFNFTDKDYDVYGYGIQAYWLKDLDIGNPSDPIDTYDIDKDPTNPDKPETPKQTPDPNNPDTPIYDSTGEKTIIKTYVDLYTDADNNTYYTKAIDQGTYIEHNTSSKVVITDESDQNGGYEISAWYTSQTQTDDIDVTGLHGTDMLQTTDHTDTLHQSIGKEQFTVDGYTSITGISDTGSQSYTDNQGGKIKTTDNSPQYTKTKDIDNPIEKDDTDKYKSKEYIDLGGDNTIVLLYTREHTYIKTNDIPTPDTPNTPTPSTPNTPTPYTPDNPDQQGELKVVKCYGVVNPDTYEITDISKSIATDVTRNVDIVSESNYRLAEYVYSTRGNNVNNWDEVTASSWGQLTNTDNDDTVFYMKGFIDGLSEPYGSALYSSKYAWTDTEQPVGSLSSTYTSDLTYPGTYGTGRLSGNPLTNYNKTIYFDMDDPDNTDTTDDVLYILFLKEDEVEYSADNFVIPESFITRHNDFATNNITVTGNLTGETSSYLFAKHKFKYSLPLVTGFSESDGDGITAWTDPYIIASISQTNTATTNGLISKWSKTELITYNPTNDTIDKRTSTDNSYELAVQKEQTTPSILSFTNANYSYTAYRKDDKPTLAQWKLEQLNSLSADSTYSMDTTGASLPLWIQGAEAFETIDSWNTDICNYSNNLVGNRQSNDTTSNFNLPLHFTDTKATGDGVDLHNIPLIDTDTTVNGNNIIRKATATISGTSTNIQLKSEYISLFDVDVTQQVDYQIHYGSSKGSSYADDTKNVTNGTGTGIQSGGVQVMKKDNTIITRKFAL